MVSVPYTCTQSRWDKLPRLLIIMVCASLGHDSNLVKYLCLLGVGRFSCGNRYVPGDSWPRLKPGQQGQEEEKKTEEGKGNGLLELRGKESKNHKAR